MGFWGTLGKGLLKAAPIAANFIPGIGPLASMGIQAALGAANAGGGWKNRLLGAGIGAATSKIPGLGKGISPSSGSFARDAVNSVANRALGGPSLLGTLGTIGKNVGTSMAANALGNMATNAMQRPNRTPPIAPTQAAPDIMEGLGPVMGRRDQSNPNLAEYIGAGRQEALGIGPQSWNIGYQPPPPAVMQPTTAMQRNPARVRVP